MNKDLIDDKYGRYYEIPRHLSSMGNHIYMLLFAYRKEKNTLFKESETLRWESINKNVLKYWLRAGEILRHEKIDVIVGSSDIQFCIVAYLLGKVYHIPVICDIYDNFETYASGKIPLFARFYYNVLKKTNGNVVFTEVLCNFIKSKSPNNHYFVIPNSVDKDKFYPIEQSTCRNRIKLSEDKILIGYFGAVSHSRGINVLFQAFSKICDDGINAELVIAGKLDKNIDLSQYKGINYLGELAHSEIPFLINACDLNIICYKEDAFSQYSFPFKAAEYIACQKPFLAPDVGGIVSFLKYFPEYLYKVGNDIDLACKVKALLNKKACKFPKLENWQEVSYNYSKIIDETLQ